MTINTSGRDLSHKAAIHTVFAVFGGLAIGAVLFFVCYALVGAIAIVTMMAMSSHAWIVVLDALVWAICLWYLFFLLSKPKLDEYITPRDRYTIVLAFTGGGMVPWIYLIFLLFVGEALRSWQHFIVLMAVPAIGYVLAAITHTIAKSHYRWSRVQQEGGK